MSEESVDRVLERRIEIERLRQAMLVAALQAGSIVSVCKSLRLPDLQRGAEGIRGLLEEALAASPKEANDDDL